MKWRPIAERPSTNDPITALIATTEESDGYYLAGIYFWRKGEWVDEDTGRRLPPGEYWWLPELELLSSLEAARGA